MNMLGIIYPESVKKKIVGSGPNAKTLWTIEVRPTIRGWRHTGSGEFRAKIDEILNDLYIQGKIDTHFCVNTNADTWFDGNSVFVNDELDCLSENTIKLKIFPIT